MKPTDQSKIRFTFEAASHRKKPYFVTKDEEGKKGRYLYGISSGVKEDGHGERMTDKAIQSFQSQAESGHLLLYPDIHGIHATKDVGQLTKSWIDENGDWQTEYRLYDGSEGAQNYQVEMANALWNQVTGAPPYSKPITKGFSIEGFIPDGGIKSIVQDADGTARRIIDDVTLDGVVCVPRPAYIPSVAAAARKALKELPAFQGQKNIRKNLTDAVAGQTTRENYQRYCWLLWDALEKQIEKLMTDDSIQEKDTVLDGILNEFAALKKPSVLQAKAYFDALKEANADSTVHMGQKQKNKMVLLKALDLELKAYGAFKLKQIQGKEN